MPWRVQRRSARSASQSLTAKLRRAAICAAAAVSLLAGCGGGSSSGSPPVRVGTPTPTPSPALNVVQISSDTFTNSTSQHATEVEPDLEANGSTLVSTFQVGRFFVAGASGIGFSTSLDGGHTWRPGVLPAITRVQNPLNAYDSASDPSVAYDVAHGVWLIASLPVINSGAPEPGALISRSRNGLFWSPPVSVAPGQKFADKTWIRCDDHTASPFYGHCYVEWDDPSENGLIKLSTSIDGGATWSPFMSPGNAPMGLGGIPVVQPNGTVVVPLDDFNQANIIAFVSKNGGASWNSWTEVATITDHEVDGGLRTTPLPTATVDAEGVVYVVWQDCRFRAGCASNDLVMSKSSDGVHWGGVVRIPIDPKSSSDDHFIPGLSVDPLTGGASAHLALAYYFYPNTNCSLASCQLDVGFVGSLDGGATWSPPQKLAGPMNLGALPGTRDGLMVGDYIATAFSNGAPYAVFAIANPAAGIRFDEATYVPRRAPPLGDRRFFARVVPDRPVPGAKSDHSPRRPRPFED